MHDLKIIESDEVELELSDLGDFEGSVFILENPNLRRLKIQARHIKGNLFIGANPNLVHIEGLEKLEEVGKGLSIEESPLLTKLPPFQNLLKVGSLSIMETGLSQIDQFPNLMQIGSVLEISENPFLSCAQFPSLEEVEWSILLEDNPLLQEVIFAPNIEIFRLFGVKNCGLLPETEINKWKARIQNSMLVRSLSNE